MSLQGEPIVVLGSYRSGTSSVSTALVNLGLYMGTQEALFPADEFNPDGHWELKDMMASHERILGAFRTSYHPALWLPEFWEELPFVQDMTRDLRALLNKHFEGRANWGWKEPATSILLPLYKKCLEQEGIQGRYLICIRHPRSVVASMMKRFVQGATEAWPEEARDQPGTAERLMSMWVSYTLSSLRESAGSNRQMIIYERYLQYPRAYIDRVANRLIPWKATEEQIVAAAATVKPQLSHANFKPEEGLDDWPSTVRETYDLCLRSDRDPDGFMSGAFDQEVDQLWSEWIRWRRMIQSPALPPSQMRFSWQSSGRNEERVVKYSPSGRWQTINVELPPQIQFAVDPYHAPCRVWIRRAVWRSSAGEKPAVIKAGPGGMIEQIAGVKRISVIGPAAMIVDSTNEGAALELDILVQSSEATLASLLSSIAARQMARG